MSINLWFSKKELLRSNHKHFVAFVILAAVLIFFYRDVVFGGKTFLMENLTSGTMSNGPFNYHEAAPVQAAIDPGAIAWINEPYNRFISRSIQKGDFPLWNPYSGLAGAPILADGQVGPLEPIQFLFYWVPDRFWPYSVDTQLLVRFLLAGFFCYLYACRLQIGLAGGIAAGILFMLGSYFVRYENHPQAKPELLLPVILYGFDRLADTQDRTGQWICVLLVGWVIIAAMPESTFFILFLSSLWFFYKGGLLLSENNWHKQTFLALLRRYFLTILVGFLLSSAYMIPFIEYLLNTTSSHAPGTSLNVFYPFWSLPGVIFQVYRPALEGFVQNYLGFCPIFLALLALVNIKRMVFRREMYFFSLYIIFFILINYNFPLTRWVSKLPVFSQEIISKYSLPSIMFCLAMLAGMVIHTTALQGLSLWSVLMAIALEFGIFIVLPYLSDPENFRSLFDGAGSSNIVKIFSFIFLLCLLAVVIAALNHLKVLSNPGCQFVLISFIFLDALFWSVGYKRPTRFDPYSPPPFVQFLQSRPEPYRIFSTDEFLYPNISSAYQIADVRWLYALVDTRTYIFSTRFIAPDTIGIRFMGEETPLSTRMFNLLNVKYWIDQAKEITPGKVVYRGNDAAIVESVGVLPRAFVVFHVAQADNFGSAIQLVSDTPGIDSGQAAVVEGFPAGLANSINQNNIGLHPAAGEFKQIDSEQVQVYVTTQNPGLLVISEQYYPGWKAELDGKSTPVYAVDAIFRGVFLPAGQHTIVFKYKPHSFEAGVAISLLMLGMIGFFISYTCIGISKTERKERTISESPYYRDTQIYPLASRVFSYFQEKMFFYFHRLCNLSSSLVKWLIYNSLGLARRMKCEKPSNCVP
jgi:hypothetical protein